MGKWKHRSKLKGARRWRIKTLIIKYHGKCVFCNIDVSLIHNSPDQATVDHIIPICKGGDEEFTNLQLLCRKCNQEKGSSIIDEDGEIFYDES